MAAMNIAATAAFMIPMFIPGVIGQKENRPAYVFGSPGGPVSSPFGSPSSSSSSSAASSSSWTLCISSSSCSSCMVCVFILLILISSGS